MLAYACMCATPSLVKFCEEAPDPAYLPGPRDGDAGAIAGIGACDALTIEHNRGGWERGSEGGGMHKKVMT